ncbi:DUF2510 domain-containing protein [Homoserinimonas sp. A447]
MGVTATTRLPAGWYPDPEGGNRRRWWDGQEWTQYTADFQRPTSVDELTLEPPIDAPSGKKKPAKAARKLRRVEDTEVPDASPATPVSSTPERLGRWLAGVVHRAPSVTKRRTRKGRRAHRSAD